MTTMATTNTTNTTMATTTLGSGIKHSTKKMMRAMQGFSLGTEKPMPTQQREICKGSINGLSTNGPSAPPLRLPLRHLPPPCHCSSPKTDSRAPPPHQPPAAKPHNNALPTPPYATQPPSYRHGPNMRNRPNSNTQNNSSNNSHSFNNSHNHSLHPTPRQ